MSQQILYTLLLKLAAAASIASVLVRLGAFQRMLLREERSLRERFLMALAFGGIFGAGSATRILTGTYQAADLALAGSLLAGVLGGYFTGLLAGILISLPGMLNHELMSMPFYAGVGVMGGLLRDIAPDPEEIWRFSPFFDTIGLYRLIRYPAERTRRAFQFLFLCTILLCAFLGLMAERIFGTRAFYTPFVDADPSMPGLVVFSTCALAVLCTAVPLKIWNSLRTERKLEAQQRLATEARLRALTYQINPHFLFNTLNSVSALIRSNPAEARQVVSKLSNILRRLLRKTAHLTTLREELAFIDDYLAIEMVRFREKLRFEREIAPETLDFQVPWMLLQPLVENSIKHGLGPKVDGGTIRIRSRMVKQRLQLTIEDDGVGIPESGLQNLLGQGIGVSNVNERLKVIFGEHYRMDVDSKPGEGTRFEIEIPEYQPVLAKAG